MTTNEIGPAEFGIVEDSTPIVNHDDRRDLLMLLRELRQLRAADVEADAWMNAVKAEFSEASNKRASRAFEVEGLIEQIAPQWRVGDSEHIDIPGYGRIQFRTTKAGVKVADPAAALAWAKEQERTELWRPGKPTADALDTNAYKKAAADALANEGVLLPGTETTPEETTMKVELR